MKMKTDYEIIDKIVQLNKEYIGLQNLESVELCRFLSPYFLKKFVTKNGNNFNISLGIQKANASFFNQFSMVESSLKDLSLPIDGKTINITTIKKTKESKIDNFIEKFVSTKNEAEISKRAKLIIKKLWKRLGEVSVNFEWEMLKYFELLRVYFWLLGYDELSDYLIKHVHKTQKILIICSKILNVDYKKINFGNDLNNLIEVSSTKKLSQLSIKFSSV